MLKTTLKSLIFLACATLGLVASTQAQPFHALSPTPELLKESEQRMWDNMRRGFTIDELEAFVRTHPNSDKVPLALERIGRSHQRSINTLKQVLAVLYNAAPSAELSKRMGLSNPQALKIELQQYVDSYLKLLDDVQAKHQAATGKAIEMGAAATGLFGTVNSDVPSPMFTAPQPPLPYKQGYSWTMRMTDLLVNKTLDYSRTVTQLLPFGYIELNNGHLVLDLDGDVRILVTPASSDGKTQQRKRSFNGNYRLHYHTLRRSEERTFGYVITDTMGDGRVFTQQGNNARVKTVGVETVTVPAGTFEAWRIERSSDWRVLEPTVDVREGSFTLSAWYVPALRRFVKYEEISRSLDGQVLRHERHELVRTD